MALLTLASCLVLAQCSWLSSTQAPSPAPRSSVATPQVRSITEANLSAAADLPAPIGGGKVGAADPAQAEVSEVGYQRDGSSGQSAFFESVGLTVLEDWMMITVHIFYSDESPYSLDVDNDEAGFAHPQLGLIAAAAKRLSE
jgi:hypothetical protein